MRVVARHCSGLPLTAVVRGDRVLVQVALGVARCSARRRGGRGPGCSSGIGCGCRRTASARDGRSSGGRWPCARRRPRTRAARARGSRRAPTPCAGGEDVRRELSVDGPAELIHGGPSLSWSILLMTLSTPAASKDFDRPPSLRPIEHPRYQKRCGVAPAGFFGPGIAPDRPRGGRRTPSCLGLRRVRPCSCARCRHRIAPGFAGLASDPGLLPCLPRDRLILAGHDRVAVVERRIGARVVAAHVRPAALLARQRAGADQPRQRVGVGEQRLEPAARATQAGRRQSAARVSRADGRVDA